MYLPKPAKRYWLVLIILLYFLIPSVNAATSAIPTITVGAPTGTIYACAGSASVSLQQFTVTGNNLTGNITAIAPAGFELSFNAASGYGNSVILKQTGGTVSNTVVYVRSAASASTGNIAGNVILSSAGAANEGVAVSGIVNPLPTVNNVGNQTLLTGAATTAISFSGAGNTAFNWVNDTPGIGLPASGSGNIGSFAAVNSGSSPVTATITVTPASEGYAYITNPGGLSVVSIATNKIIATLTTTPSPFCVCISPDGSKAYFGCSDGGSKVLVVNTTTNNIINTIPVSSSGESTGITISPDGTMLYVANYVDNTVTAVNAITGAVVAVIPVGPYPYGITTTPDGSKVYVAFTYTDYISVISTATNTVTGNITVGEAPSDVVMSKDGSKLYVPAGSPFHVAVIDPTTNTVIKSILLDAAPTVLALSPDGNTAYVASNSYASYPYKSSVLVVNTSTNAVLATIPVGDATNGISISSDGRFVYTANTETNDVSVINTSTNTVIATIEMGGSPISLGNFVTPGTGCTGAPTTFTITVNPTPRPTITAGNSSGSIYSCSGTESVSPNIQQFTVSGSNLTGDISAAAPAGFEISTNLNNGYASTLTLPESSGVVSNTTIYVRSAATAAAGSITGQVTLTSPGAATINTAVQGMVGTATVNAIQPQIVINGLQTSAINFTGTATNYNWVNDTPAIGLAASGSGNIAPFTTINTGSTPIIATITITPATSGGDNITCTGTPITLTITVNPSPKATITTGGTLEPLNTIYGTPSTSTILNISGTALTEGILMTPPPGFEVSTDDITFTKTLTLGTGGNISTTTVYIRLAASTPVGGYSGNIILSSGNAIPVDIVMPAGTVSPTLLTITADNKSKAYGTVNPLLTASYAGFVNNEGVAQLTVEPQISTTAITTSPIGEYPIIVSGGLSTNYTFVYIAGVLTVYPPSLIIPNTFTPNGDGINDTWDIKYLENYPNCMVDIFNRYGERLYSSIGYPIPWDGKYKGTNLPAGTYYYIIDTKSNLKTFAGYITIIR